MIKNQNVILVKLVASRGHSIYGGLDGISRPVGSDLSIDLIFCHLHQEAATLRIDYCDERLVYLNGYICRTSGGTYTYYTSIKSPDFPIFNFYFFIQDISLGMALIISKFYMPVVNNHMDLRLSFILC